MSRKDKISIECKFVPHNTSVAHDTRLSNLGYVKTVYAYLEDTTSWSCIENEQALKVKYTFETQEERPPRMIIIRHPPKTEKTAYLAAADHTGMCYYCGDTNVHTCSACDLELCNDCFQSVGCLCHKAPDEEVVIDGFVPKPGQSKTTHKIQAFHIIEGL